MYSERIKEERENHGLSQAQLAEKVGVTKQAINGYEHGTRHPTPAVLINIAKVFGVTTDYLLGVE